MNESDNDDLDLSSDDGHAGDDWETLLADAGSENDPGGQIMAFPAPEADDAAAGWADILAGAFRSTSHVFALNLAEEEVSELARAWGRVAGHYLPECPTQASPIMDALYTTGVIATPRVIAHFTQPAQEQAEPGQEPAPKASGNVVSIRRADDPNAWVNEREKDW